MSLPLSLSLSIFPIFSVLFLDHCPSRHKLPGSKTVAAEPGSRRSYVCKVLSCIFRVYAHTRVLVRERLSVCTRRSISYSGAKTGTWLAAGYITQAIALESAQAGTTAFLCSLTTVVCPVIEKLTGAKISPQAWAAAALAVVGAGVLELGGDVTPSVGDLWALGQPIGFGIFFFETQKAMEKHPDQALPITVSQTMMCAAGAVLWMAVAHQDLGAIFAKASTDWTFDAALLWIGLVSTALILLLETIALGVLPSSETAVVFSSEPLWGTLFAVLLLHEAVTPETILGGGMIIGACLLRVADLQSLKERFKNMFST
eukprot:Tamp_15728.p1 GENE.Tamp_15728~~Tamp_15728.p1  ORF type:complete len:315 (+),score=28.95 Tamp_15728:480-1424(+)